MAELPTDRYIVEIALTHDHFEGQRMPDCFQALAVPLAVDAHAMIADAVGEPLWDEAVPVTPPVPFDIIEQDTGFGRFCELAAECWPEDNQPERFDFSLEGEDDCAICKALVETDLRSQGKVV